MFDEVVKKGLDIEGTDESLNKLVQYGVTYNGGIIWALLFWPSFLAVFYGIFLGPLSEFKNVSAFVFLVILGIIGIALTWVSLIYRGTIERVIHGFKGNHADEIADVKRTLSDEKEELRGTLTTEREELRKTLMAEKDDLRKHLEAQKEEIRKDLEAKKEDVRKELTKRIEDDRKQYGQGLKNAQDVYLKANEDFLKLASKWNREGAWDKIGHKDPEELKTFVDRFNALGAILAILKSEAPPAKLDQFTEEENP